MFFEKIMSFYYIMFECSDFQYVSSMPTDDACLSPVTILAREKLLQKFIGEAEEYVGSGRGTRKGVDGAGVGRCFAIDDLIEDEFEYLGGVGGGFEEGEF